MTITSILRPIILPASLAGSPAPFDLFDKRGQLLLRKGNTLGPRLVAATDSPRFFCKASQSTPVMHRSPMRTLRKAGEALATLEQLITTGHTPEADTFIDLAAQCHAAWRLDPDACIGFARLTRPISPAIGHVLLAAMFAAEIGHAHGLPHGAISNLVGAALTMNLGSLALHDQMHELVTAPDPEARHALNQHPHRAAGLLASLNTLPRDWLRAVAEHHENIDGTGYPQGLQRSEISLGARALRVADVLAARLLGRRGRTPCYWNIGKTGSGGELLEHVFGDDLQRLDRHLARLLITRLGRFPPGSMVRLSNGELAVVSRRQEGRSPREALSVLSPSGLPHSQPRPRQLGAHDHRIQGYAHDEQTHRLPDYDWAALWGYGQTAAEDSARVH